MSNKKYSRRVNHQLIQRVLYRTCSDGTENKKYKKVSVNLQDKITDNRKLKQCYFKIKINLAKNSLSLV